MAKAKATSTYLDNHGGISFLFTDDTTLSCEVSKLSEEIKLDLMIHGLSQKVRDSGAGCEALPDYKAALQATWDSLCEGKWTSRVAGEGKAAQPTLLAEAVAKLTGQPIDVVKAKLAEKSEDDRKALQASPKVQAAIASIKLERLREQEKRLRNEAKMAEGTDPIDSFSV